MEDNSDVDSEGSDIEVDNIDEDDLLNDELELREVNNDADEWLAALFESDSENEEEFEGFQEEWSQNNFTRRTLLRFKLVEGATFQSPEEAEAHHYFELLWTNEMWNTIVEETNRYAEQERTRQPPTAKSPKWTPVDKPVMKAFIGLCFAMGILRLPSRHNYWRQNKFMFVTSFNKIMSRDRFDLIWRYLHLHNNQAPEVRERPDKLKKLRWYLDFLDQKFAENFIPKTATIDESMIKFKGRLAFRQYLPSKPTEWGVKLWNMADSQTGYMHRFQVYSGKEDGQEKGLTHRVVTDLCSHMYGKNLRLYFDNFYTSVDLLKDLHMRGVLACGTVRTNRKGLPKELLPKNIKLNKHQFKVAQKDELTYCVWQDTKAVCVLSNFHDPEEQGRVNRRSGLNDQRQIDVPKMLSDYQKHMKGVDLCDQMVGYYLLNHRSKKWWRRIFFYLMLASGYNAYVIAKDTNPDVANNLWPTFQMYLEDLVLALIGDIRGGKAPALVPQPNRVGINQHSFERIFDKNKTCYECSLALQPGQRRGVTKFGCRNCNIPVHTECQTKHIMRCANYV